VPSAHSVIIGEDLIVPRRPRCQHAPCGAPAELNAAPQKPGLSGSAALAARRAAHSHQQLALAPASRQYPEPCHCALAEQAEQAAGDSAHLGWQDGAPAQLEGRQVGHLRCGRCRTTASSASASAERCNRRLAVPHLQQRHQHQTTGQATVELLAMSGLDHRHGTATQTGLAHLRPAPLMQSGSKRSAGSRQLCAECRLRA
jgi:hypothetical protein